MPSSSRQRGWPERHACCEDCGVRVSWQQGFMLARVDATACCFGLLRGLGLRTRRASREAGRGWGAQASPANVTSSAVTDPCAPDSGHFLTALGAAGEVRDPGPVPFASQPRAAPAAPADTCLGRALQHRKAQARPQLQARLLHQETVWIVPGSSCADSCCWTSNAAASGAMRSAASGAMQVCLPLGHLPRTCHGASGHHIMLRRLPRSDSLLGVRRCAAWKC